MHREGVFRIKMGFPDDSDGDYGDFSCFQQKWESVQNFDFRLFIGPGRRSRLDYCPMFRQLRTFVHLNDPSLKRDCRITVGDDSSDPPALVCHDFYKMKDLFAEIARITTCLETIELFTTNGLEPCIVCKFFIDREHNEHLDVVDKKLIVDTLSTLKGRLDSILGPARVLGDTDGELLELMNFRALRDFTARKQ